MNAKVLSDVNKALKEGKITITRNGLLSQDFETTNGKLRVETRRLDGYGIYILRTEREKLKGK